LPRLTMGPSPDTHVAQALTSDSVSSSVGYLVDSRVKLDDLVYSHNLWE
jgi:hypothetical protein